MSIQHVAMGLRLLARAIEKKQVPDSTCSIYQLDNTDTRIHITLDFKKNEAALQAFVTKLLISGAINPGVQPSKPWPR